MLIPISFAIIMMGLIRIWMFSAPTRIRRKPKYSMHVMRQLKKAQGNGRKASIGGGAEGGGIGQKVNDDRRRRQSYGGDTPDDVTRRPIGFGYEDPLPHPPPSAGFITPASGHSYNYL